MVFKGNTFQSRPENSGGLTPVIQGASALLNTQASQLNNVRDNENAIRRARLGIANNLLGQAAQGFREKLSFDRKQNAAEQLRELEKAQLAQDAGVLSQILGQDENTARIADLVTGVGSRQGLAQALGLPQSQANLSGSLLDNTAKATENRFLEDKLKSEQAEREAKLKGGGTSEKEQLQLEKLRNEVFMSKLKAQGVGPKQFADLNKLGNEAKNFARLSDEIEEATKKAGSLARNTALNLPGTANIGFGGKEGAENRALNDASSASVIKLARLSDQVGVLTDKDVELVKRLLSDTRISIEDQRARTQQALKMFVPGLLETYRRINFDGRYDETIGTLNRLVLKGGVSNTDDNPPTSFQNQAQSAVVNPNAPDGSLSLLEEMKRLQGGN